MDYDRKEEEGSGRCLECGEPLGYGRKGRKFCSGTCKNHWHNRDRHHSEMLRRRVLKMLDRNYHLLEEQLRVGHTAVPLDYMALCGFEPRFYTSRFSPGRGERYCCFDLSYRLSDVRVYDIRYWAEDDPSSRP